MKIKYRRIRCSSTALLLILAPLGNTISASELIVDNELVEGCRNYSIAARACGQGDDFAFSTISAAMRNAMPGDEILLRGGQYRKVSIDVSGTKERPIVVRPFSSELVVITNKDQVALKVIGQSDIVIRGLSVENVLGFGRIEDSQRVRIERIKFYGAGSDGTTGSLKFVRSSENLVTQSSFQSGSDLIVIQDNSNQNLISGNTFGEASHSLISIRCSGENVIQNNEFANPRQKALEIYDCEGVSDAPVRLESTKRNVIEHNWFRQTAPSSREHKYNAIQHGGQRTIVRYNVFSGNEGGGVNYQYYTDESLFVYGNRLYNNTFVGNRCGAIIGQIGAKKQMYDNLAVNNLLYRNVDCQGNERQTSIVSKKSVILKDNLMAKSDPGLRSGQGKLFCLSPESKAIDAGIFVAKTVEEGSGRIIRVDDTSWFSDGYGIKDGDLIQFFGDTTLLRVIAVDDKASTLTVAQDFKWYKGQGVHLVYKGAGPDQGAFELGSAECDAAQGSEDLP